MSSTRHHYNSTMRIDIIQLKLIIVHFVWQYNYVTVPNNQTESNTQADPTTEQSTLTIQTCSSKMLNNKNSCS